MSDWRPVLPDEMGQAAVGKRQKAKGKGQRAKGKRQKAKGKRQKAKERTRLWDFQGTSLVKPGFLKKSGFSTWD